MKGKSSRKIKFVLYLFLFVATLGRPAVFAGAQIRYDLAHQDTVRIYILENTQWGGWNNCPAGTWGGYGSGTHVSEETKNMILSSMGPLGALPGVPAKNIAVSRRGTTTWDDIENHWGDDSLPHVIVDAQAGHWDRDKGDVEAIMTMAVQNKIGVVSVGDDAAFLAEKTFGFNNVNNMPPPIGSGRGNNLNQPDDSLWITLNTANDVPHEPGVIKNAVNSILSDPLLVFKTYVANGRCECDADKYSVIPEYLSHVGFMGYQRGWDRSANGGAGGYVGGATDLPVIATYLSYQRRGVALSFQPTYVVNTAAAEQIIYDAIMWASKAHKPKTMKYQVIR